MKYIIDFKDTATLAEIKDYLDDLAPTSIKELSHYDKSVIIVTTTTPPHTSIIEHIIDDISAPISLLSYTQTFNHYDDELVTEIEIGADHNWWKAAVIKAPDYDTDTNTHTVRGNNVNVYIFDSGIESSHPEFVDTTINNIFSITGEYGDTRGHGTALASVISGKTCGLTNANICVVKIFDNNVTTYQSDMLMAMDAVLADYHAKGKPVSVANLSWSIGKNTYIESKIQAMIDAGIFVVCSAGNSGIPIENVTPASMDSVITVGSFNSDLVPSDFSNFSNQHISLSTGEVNTGELDGWSPGENISVALLGGSLGNVNGTSISAAIHSGAIAYNSVEYFTDNEKFPDCFAYSGNIRWAVNMSFGKRGILTLGEKYQDSKNIITVYATLSGPQPISSGIRMKLKAGTTLCRKLFATSITSINVLNADEMPLGLRLERSYLLGTLPEISTDVETHELMCNIVTLSGVERPYTIFLGIYNSALDLESVVPGDNPELDITLLVDQCCGPIIAPAPNCQTTTDDCNSEACEFQPGDCLRIAKGGPCACT